MDSAIARAFARTLLIGGLWWTACAHAQSQVSPSPGYKFVRAERATPKLQARMDEAAAKIKACAKQDPTIDIPGMVECSGYVVNSAMLAACLDPEGVDYCLPPKLCADKESPEVAGCAPGPDKNGKIWSEPQWRKLQRFSRIESSLPSAALPTQATLNRMKAQCKPGVGFEACVAREMMPPEDQKLHECIKSNSASPVQAVVACKKVPLSKQEQNFADCALGKGSVDEAKSGCDATGVAAPKITALASCQDSKSFIELTGCLAYAGQSPERIKQAICLSKAAAQQTWTEALIAECFPSDWVSKAQAEVLKKAVLGAQECLKDAKADDPESMLACAPGGRQVVNKYPENLACVKGKSTLPYSDSLLDCVDMTPEIASLRDCFKNHSTDIGDLAADCTGTQLPPEKAALTRCAGRLWQTKESGFEEALRGCESALGGMKAQLDVLTGCKAAYDKTVEAGKLKARGDLVSCALFKGGAGAAATCLIGGDSRSALEFASDCHRFLNNKTLSKLAQAGKCYSNKEGATGFAVCMAGGKLDNKVAAYLDCIQDSKSTSGAKLACIAGQQLPQKQRDFIECGTRAASSYSSGALCAAQKWLNLPSAKGSEELAVVAECAVYASTGWGFVGCVAGQLTLEELTKCANGIGTKNGCFGPNNDVRNFIEDLAHFAFTGTKAAWVLEAKLAFALPRVGAGVLDGFVPGNPFGNAVSKAGKKVERWIKKI